MAKFNKTSFVAWARHTLSLSREDAGHLYDTIGGEIRKALVAGDTANLFGQGILQIVPRRATGVLRLAYRPPVEMTPGAMGVNPNRRE